MNNVTTPRCGGGQARDYSEPVADRTFTLAQSLIERIALELDGEVLELVGQVEDLMRQMAGFLPDPTGDDARRRLQNPRLRTTVLDHTIRALTAKTIDLREEVAGKLKDIMGPALKLEVAEANLAAAVARKAELDAVKVAREATGLFPAVAVAADYLHDQYGVSHWHWANAGPDLLKLVAQVLRRDASLISREEREAESLKRTLYGPS